MQIYGLKITILLTLISLFPFSLQAKKNPVLNALTIQHNSTNNTYSPFLRGFGNPRFSGCWRRPWICNNREDFPRIRWRCCRNRCVDVTSDVNNCGLCGIRCPFTWTCCRGICVNTNVNPFNCGRCFNRCPFPSFCFYGMCGYAQPLPPFPFPPRPPRPRPWPPRPRPWPPRPRPRPWPPRGGGGPPVDEWALFAWDGLCVVVYVVLKYCNLRFGLVFGSNNMVSFFI